MEKNNQEDKKLERKKREQQLLHLFRQDPRLKLMIKRVEKKIEKKKKKDE